MVDIETERRACPRLDVNMIGRYATINFIGKPSKKEKTEVRNISSTGAFVATNNPPHKGAIIHLEFCLIRYNNPTKAEAIVRWHGKINDSTHGMGVEFISVN